MTSPDDRVKNDALLREVVALRAEVAELQRAAARYEDTEGLSLAEREELLREAERIAHLGTWTWDMQSGRVSWSNEMFLILGFEPGSLTPSAEGFFEAVHPEDRPQILAIIEQAKAAGLAPHVDCRMLRPDGSVRHTTISGSYIFDEHGQPRRMVGSVLDRTATLQAEFDLRHTLALLEEAQKSAQLGSWRYDPATHETEWSTEFRRIAGLPMDLTPQVELFLDRIVPKDREHFTARYLETLRNPQGGEIDGCVQRADGEIRHIRLKGALVQTEGGRAELRGTMLDVTDQIRLREDLASSQRMEAVGRLAGGIAHDFNNLLTIVHGNVELLAEEHGRTPELSDCLQALDSAANLTRRLLAFGRKAQLSLKVVETNQLVQATMNLLQRLLGDRIGLRTDLADRLPLVKVDPVEIERALVNLVVNAKGVMSRGGVITIATRHLQTEWQSWVEIAVTDEGPGISDKDRPHLFEPFYTTRASDGGTGLGLATVLGTAEQHGGTVRVESTEGEGSTFILVLPVGPTESEDEEGHLSERGTRSDPHLHTLLVIDDEPKVAEVTRRMLTARGHTVHLASNPSEAAAIWVKYGEEIDLVICDVVMPALGGPELVQHLATLGAQPCVLFMSGYNEEATRADLGHPFLAKPFTAQSLAAAMERAITTIA